MEQRHRTAGLKAVAALGVMLVIAGSGARAAGQSVIDEWSAVKAPPPPEVKAVNVDPRTTALLLLDFNRQTCNAERRPRCIASLPRVQKLLAAARTAKSPVIYSLSPGAAVVDIAPDLAPAKGDPVVTSGPDKFLGTDLERILKEHNVSTVIVAGTAAHGAVLHTAGGAALRGLRVIVVVDGISAETLYPEQYALWHLVNAPRISNQATLSRTDLISY
jgi:nicotinamidase-related amidase